MTGPSAGIVELIVLADMEMGKRVLGTLAGKPGSAKSLVAIWGANPEAFQRPMKSNDFAVPPVIHQYRAAPGVPQSAAPSFHAPPPTSR